MIEQMFLESRIEIKDLVVSGIHGSTEREPHDKQRFRVSMKIDVDAGQAALTDSIKHAFDYKIAASIAKDVIGRESHVLLEKIVARIITRICQYSHVRTVEVTIEKLDASQHCTPSFTGSMKRTPQEQRLEKILPFDCNAIVKALDDTSVGAISIPLLPETYRQILLDEAEMYDYVYSDEVVGPAKVREQLYPAKNLYSGSLFFRLRDEFQTALLAGMSQSLFEPALDLNELVLTRYNKDSIGITPHRDFLQNVNLICIVILAGKGNFGTCEDREGKNAKSLCTTPGNVIIMRGPGFNKSNFRPFHFISDITERRVVCAMRQYHKE